MNNFLFKGPATSTPPDPVLSIYGLHVQQGNATVSVPLKVGRVSLFPERFLAEGMSLLY